MYGEDEVDERLGRYGVAEGLLVVVFRAVADMWHAVVLRRLPGTHLQIATHVQTFGQADLGGERFVASVQEAGIWSMTERMMSMSRFHIDWSSFIRSR